MDWPERPDREEATQLGITYLGEAVAQKVERDPDAWLDKTETALLNAYREAQAAKR